MTLDAEQPRSGGNTRGTGDPTATGPATCEMVENLPFATDGGIAERAAIGLIVLATDNTIEYEFRRVFDLAGVGLYAARIRNSAQITPQTLAALAPSITATTDLILPGMPMDVVGFGCTSASMVLGEERVFELISAARPKAKPTTPITAAFAAFDACGAKRIAVLTPYRKDVNDIVRNYIEKRGYEVPVFGSFNEEDDNRVSRISPDSLLRGIDRITSRHLVDMVFVSCTSLRLVDAAAAVEAKLGLPVTSSNHALAWHSLRLAGIADRLPRFGRLFTQ